MGGGGGGMKHGTKLYLKVPYLAIGFFLFREGERGSATIEELEYKKCGRQGKRERERDRERVSGRRE